MVETSFHDLQLSCHRTAVHTQDMFIINLPGSPAQVPLRELVYGGIPFEIRAKAWAVFLDISVRKQKGYYQVNKEHFPGYGVACPPLLT